jgi:EAL domain-containing protein (putative c-di-GMP-specific phosphodiesterase class I)
MDTDSRDLELVRMIIQLAHTLGMEVVSEGIETKSQLDLLSELDCEFGQGFFFAKPLPADEAVLLLADPPVWR